LLEWHLPIYMENIKEVLYELWKYCHHLRLIIIRDLMKESRATDAFYKFDSSVLVSSKTFIKLVE
jgi:hypothetical protein